MPWLTLGEPGFITFLHQAQTSVGNLRAALTTFFMIGALDRGSVVFVQLVGTALGCPLRQTQDRVSEHNFVQTFGNEAGDSGRPRICLTLLMCLV
jgi:hypothetical protein